MNYNIKFNDYQRLIFNQLEMNEHKRKLQSVFSYLIKYSDENGKVTKSLNRLYSMYLRYHDKMSKATFYNIVNKLIDMKLVEKFNVELYIKLETNLETKIEIEEVAQTVENTNVEPIQEKPNSSHPREYNNTVITLSDEDLKSASNEFDTQVRLNINKTKNAYRNIVKAIMTKYKLFNTYIYSLVCDKVFKYFNKIDVCGAYQYIENIVKEKMILNQAYIAKCELLNKDDKYNKPYQNRYERRKYKKASTFNNFEQRDYNWDMLEKAVLGQVKIENTYDLIVGAM